MKKRKRNNTAAIAFAMLLAVSCLAGCGTQLARSRYDASYYSPSLESGSYGNGALTPQKASYSSAQDTMYTEKLLYDEPYDDDVSFLTAGKETLEEPAAGSDEQDHPDIDAEKLVYTGNLTVETTQFTLTLSRIRDTITEMGGFIESEEDSDDSNGWYREGYTKSSSTLRTYLQARIPSSRFYEFLDGIEGDGAKVINRSVNVRNISRQYSEIATTIESYEIQEQRLLEMMKDATRVSDMLEIEARLSEVQNSLKQYSNTLAGMDTDVAYSTVSIDIREVGIYSQPEAATFMERLKESFSNGIHNFRTGCEAFIIWLAGNFLGIIVFLVVVWLIIAIIKLLVRRIFRRAKREKKTGKRNLHAGREPSDTPAQENTPVPEKETRQEQ